MSIREQAQQRQNHAVPAPASRPTLLIFGSATSGPCRRVEGFLAQVLQRRHNHATFVIRHVDAETQPDLAGRFAVERVPTIIVHDNGRVRARLEQPRSCVEITTALAPWLQ